MIPTIASLNDILAKHVPVNSSFVFDSLNFFPDSLENEFLIAKSILEDPLMQMKIEETKRIFNNNNSFLETKKENLITDLNITKREESLLNKTYEEKLLKLIDSEEPETGVESNAERYFKEILKEDAMVALNTLSRIFMANYSLTGRKINRIVSILHLLSHIEYKTVHPMGPSLALNGLNHKNDEVNEYAIKCFENWENPESIENLKAVSFSKKWLRDYANQVIKDLSGGLQK